LKSAETTSQVFFMIARSSMRVNLLSHATPLAATITSSINVGADAGVTASREHDAGRVEIMHWRIEEILARWSGATCVAKQGSTHGSHPRRCAKSSKLEAILGGAENHEDGSGLALPRVNEGDELAFHGAASPAILPGAPPASQA
jgi:hypothetical protein